MTKLNKLFKKEKKESADTKVDLKVKAAPDKIKKHHRVGDYCNDCDCHVSECPSFN